MKQGFLKSLLRSKQTVFTFSEILLIWGSAEPDLAKARLHNYVRNGELLSIRKGVYAKDSDYDRKELATKLYTPSYISFETVLSASGVIFQRYSQLFVASYQTREVQVDGQTIAYKKLKDEILLNPEGLETQDFYSSASTERAFLDTVYLYKRYYFDNLLPLNWDKVYSLLPLYQNKAMIARVHRYQDLLSEGNV